MLFKYIVLIVAKNPQLRENFRLAHQHMIKVLLDLATANGPSQQVGVPEPRSSADRERSHIACMRRDRPSSLFFVLHGHVYSGSRKSMVKPLAMQPRGSECPPIIGRGMRDL